ncbi:STAS domain-containing protein [Alkalicoccus saliphilus]|nr:STAS domain-containing protein [Alkalicoccus saliphilus]
METQAPLPLVKINAEGEIKAWTREASSLFPEASLLMELIEEGSREKFNNILMQQQIVRGAEINIYSRDGGAVLCSIFASPVEEGWEVAFAPLSDSYHKVSSRLLTLQTRLSETNFELYEKSEKLQHVVKRSDKLSGPFIELTENMALIPLFGDLTVEKLTAIEEQALQGSYYSQPERILIDFTGVGTVDEEGVQKFSGLVLVFQQMGIKIVLIGLHPSHARVLAPVRSELEVEFDHSAKTAVEKWLRLEKEEEGYEKTSVDSLSIWK